VAWNPLTIHGHNATHEWWCPNLNFSMPSPCSLCLCGECLLKDYSPQMHRGHRGFTEKTAISSLHRNAGSDVCQELLMTLLLTRKLIQVFLS